MRIIFLFYGLVKTKTFLYFVFDYSPTSVNDSFGCSIVPMHALTYQLLQEYAAGYQNRRKVSTKHSDTRNNKDLLIGSRVLIR